MSSDTSIQQTPNKLLSESINNNENVDNNGNNSVIMPSLGILENELKDSAVMCDILISEYSKLDDLHKIKLLKQSYTDINIIRNNKNNTIKQTIQSLLNNVTQLKQVTDNPPINALQSQYKQLTQQQQHLNTNIEQLSNDINNKLSNIDNYELEANKYKSKLHNIQKEKSIKLPIEAQTVGLYQGSTDIVWDYNDNDNNNNELLNSVSGTFHFNNPAKIIPFSYGIASITQPVGSYNSKGSQVKTQFDIANTLWNTMWLNTVQQQQQ